MGSAEPQCSGTSCALLFVQHAQPVQLCLYMASPGRPAMWKLWKNLPTGHPLQVDAVANAGVQIVGVRDLSSLGVVLGYLLHIDSPIRARSAACLVPRV